MTIKPQARALLGVTALALAGLLATAAGAQAAATATPALHGTRIALGATSSLYENAFTEAPNGTVFFSRGSVVYAVEGNRAPVIALHAGRAVLALGASDSDLFVETGLQVTEYSRATGGQVRRIHTSSSAVHVVDRDAFPGDMSADGAGLYFETVHGVTEDLARANPTTSAVQYRKAPVDAPLALSGGRVDLLAFGTSAADVLSYNATTLALVSSKRVPEKDSGIAGTGPGLLVLAEGCGGFPCSSATVGLLNTGTGGTSAALSTPGAYQLLNGPAVIEASDVHGTHADLFLVRISS